MIPLTYDDDNLRIGFTRRRGGDPFVFSSDVISGVFYPQARG